MKTDFKDKQYKVGILDDEMLIRKSIAMKMDHFGFKVCLDSDDGYGILEYLKENGQGAIDLLFVDVEMPLMNGLEFIQQARVIDPDLVFIIISGYSEFEYVQEALRQGVKDYILKPIEPEKLNDVLEKVYLLLQERERRISGDLIDELSLYISCAGKIPLSDSMVRSLKSRLEQGFQVIMSMLGNLESGEQWFGRYSGDTISFIYPSKPNLLISLTDSYSRSQYLRELQVSTSTTFVSARLKEPSKLYNTIREGLIRIQENLILGEHTELREEGFFNRYAGIRGMWEKKEQRTLDAMGQLIKKKDYSRITEQVLDLFSNPGIPQVLIEKTWKKIANQLYREFRIDDLLFEESWMREIDEPEVFRREILYLLNQTLGKEREGTVSRSAKDAINDILVYMNENYNRDISLRDIAENRYYVNRSHLSRVFRSETGMTFNDMLVKIRVGKACEFLREDQVKIRDVAEFVGFRDGRYFSQVFQKVTGRSPRDYRNEKRG